MKNKLTATGLLLSLLAGGNAYAADTKSPKIVVGIVVDQLRTDYIEQLRPFFGENGFNRLMREGVYIPDVDFHGTVADGPSGAAVIYTGAWPAVNGVGSAHVLDRQLMRSVPVLSDPSKTRLEYTPENLRVSTLADEFSIYNGNLSKIYSIAGDPQTAVISAGHAGNSAIWFDETSGKWASPAYYGTIPPAIANRNRITPLASKITASNWRPLHPASLYPMASAWNGTDFSYTYSGGNRDANIRFKASAPFNTELTDVAIELIKSLNSGHPGFVNIEYSLSPYAYDYDGDNRPELVDSYLRLDSDIERLLDSIDREYGADNAVVFLTSTGYAAEPEVPDESAKIPTGEITLKQVESLLNSYLSASHGNADYVSMISGGKLYLNTKEIGRRNLDLQAFRADAKAFLMRMGGVSEAFTIDEILRSDSSRARDMALGIDAKNAPDVFLFFQPGWTVTDDNAFPAISEKVRLAVPSTPAFIMAPLTEPQVVTYTIDATAIAPTVASLLRIRAPNAAAGKPLTLTTKNDN